MNAKAWLAGLAGFLMALMLALPGVTSAGGFQITELCAECSGARIAGQAATATGAATVWFNPAGMTRLEGKQIDASVHYISGKFEFKNRDSRKALAVEPGIPPTTVSPGGPAVGDPKKDGAEPAFVPNLYLTWKFNEKWAAGVGINAPYGLVTEYDREWVGRYQAVKSDLLTVNINPSVAYKVNDWLSLGAGVSAVYADVSELSNAVDVGSIFNGYSPALGQSIGLQPSMPGSDGFAKLDGTDWGWGWNVGALLSFNEERTRVGVAYRSQVDTTIDGTLRTTLPAQVQKLNYPLVIESDGEADLNLPATFTLGISHDINDQWTVLGGAMWTGWSSFDEIRVKLDDGGQIVQPEEWSDVWRWQLGAEYRHSPRWTFRAGYEYDNSPVDPVFNTARIPDEDRQWLALGFTYSWSEELKIDFAYSHIFIDDYDINEKEVFTEQAGERLLEPLAQGLGMPVGDRLHGVGNILNGSYDSSADIFSLGIRYSFW